MEEKFLQSIKVKKLRDLNVDESAIWILTFPRMRIVNGIERD